MIALKNYIPALATDWTGRNDGENMNVQRWFQQVYCCDLSKEKLPALNGGKGVVILGFSVDEGVRRNLGRIGAAAGPAALKKACAGLPVHFKKNFSLVDGGTLCCQGTDLENAQDQLSLAVAEILRQGYRPLVWGGGHELMYGHYSGIRRHLASDSGGKRIGIINFDAHFDLRPVGEAGATSGTGFWQVAEDCRISGEPFTYLALGIQKNSNTRLLFDTAESLDTAWVEGKYFSAENSLFVESKIEVLLERSDAVYLTVCMDVFAAPFAPGVSAPAFSGLVPDPFFNSIFRKILKSQKLISLDIAELNPQFDLAETTARLAAALSFEIIDSMTF